MSGSDDGISAVKIAVAILIAIAVISIVLAIFYYGKGTANESLESANKITSELSDSDKKMYDNSNVAGTEVINAITRYQNDDFGIKVITKKNAAGVWYNHSVAADGSIGAATGNIANAKTVTNSAYINPAGLFKGEIIRDANDVVVGVVFKQQ